MTWSIQSLFIIDWKVTWDKEGGGVVIDQTIHSLDIVNWFINDEPVYIQTNLYNRNNEIMEVDDSTEGFIKYKHGATLSFWVMNNYGCDDAIEIRVFCENEKAVLSYDEAKITFNSGKTEEINQDMQNCFGA